MQHSLCHFISYHHYSHSHLHYVANISNDREPISYDDVVFDPKWYEAMDFKLQALITNQT